jgi:hypothetical protein
MGCQGVKQLDLAITKVRAAGLAPQPKVTESTIAVKKKNIDTVMKAISLEKVVIKFSSPKHGIRCYFLDQCGSSLCPQLKSVRVAKLILVSSDVFWIHIVDQGRVKPRGSVIPDIRCSKIRSDELDDISKTAARTSPSPSIRSSRAIISPNSLRSLSVRSRTSVTHLDLSKGLAPVAICAIAT